MIREEPYEHECDDTRCFYCTAKLPEEIPDDGPLQDGFCDERCKAQTGIIGNLAELATHVGAAYATEASVGRRLYKDTSCGITFGLESSEPGVPDTVCVSGYVEGIDAECPSHGLQFPFWPDAFDDAVEWCEQDAEELCDNWNSQERYDGKD